MRSAIDDWEEEAAIKTQSNDFGNLVEHYMSLKKQLDELFISPAAMETEVKRWPVAFLEREVNVMEKRIAGEGPGNPLIPGDGDYSPARETNPLVPDASSQE